MFKSTAKNWFICLIFIVLFAVWDYLARLNTIPLDEESKSIIQTSTSTTTSRLEQPLKAKILALYSHYDLPPEVVVDIPVSAPVVKKGLSPAEQNEQKGTLAKFYLGDYSYTPLGVFKGEKQNGTHDEIFAVLIQQHVETNVSKEIKVLLNQSLPPYLVSNITETMIEFSAGTRVIQLSLFNN